MSLMSTDASFSSSIFMMPVFPTRAAWCSAVMLETETRFNIIVWTRPVTRDIVRDITRDCHAEILSLMSTKY